MDNFDTLMARFAAEQQEAFDQVPTQDPKERLAQIDARERAAGKGPWRAYEAGQGDNFIVDERGFLMDGVVCGPTYEKANAELIAAAREDIPFLLGLIRRQNTQLAAVIELARAYAAQPDTPEPCGAVAQGIAESLSPPNGPGDAP